MITLYPDEDAKHYCTLCNDYLISRCHKNTGAIRKSAAGIFFPAVPFYASFLLSTQKNKAIVGFAELRIKMIDKHFGNVLKYHLMKTVRDSNDGLQRP